MINRRYDRIRVGVLAGTIVPVLVFVFLYVVFDELSQLDLISSEGFSPGFRTRTIALVSIGGNAILVHYFKNRYAYQAIRGVVFPTFVYIIAWIIFYSSALL